MKKLLLFGSTGKMGTAIKQVLSGDFEIISLSRDDFSVTDRDSVHNVVAKYQPNYILNTIALLGIDPAKQDPLQAMRTNAFFPQHLVDAANKHGATLVHFSTDSVFHNHPEQGFWLESDTPQPLNVYGASKYLADQFITRLADNYYIIRVSVLFGPSTKANQFIEKMLSLAATRDCLQLAEDIILSPCYSLDVAQRVKQILQDEYEHGLYHVVNSEQASLYDFTKHVFETLGLPHEIKAVDSSIFPALDEKNKVTPMASTKLPEMRSWRDAATEYFSANKDRILSKHLN